MIVPRSLSCNAPARISLDEALPSSMSTATSSSLAEPVPSAYSRTCSPRRSSV